MYDEQKNMLVFSEIVVIWITSQRVVNAIWQLPILTFCVNDNLLYTHIYTERSIAHCFVIDEEEGSNRTKVTHTKIID